MLCISLTLYHPPFISLGIKDRAHLDDSQYSMKEMMGLLALQFNNEEIVLALPCNDQGLDDYQDLNPNDQRCIRIPRDWTG